MILILPRICQSIPIVDDWFYPKLGNLEIEIFGSGLMALIIGLFLLVYEDDIRNKQNKERSSRYFNNIVTPAIKKGFKRIPSGLNRNSIMNQKAYFDNSSINNIHDVIEKHLDEIYEYIDYNERDLLARRLVSYYANVEEAYIKGEELDILLRSMAFMVNMLPDNSQGVLYLKALRYAKFSKEELRILLPMYQYDADFYEKYFKNPEKGLKESYRKRFLELDPKIDKIINDLKKESKNIKNLLGKR